ncbi:LysR family transcriptional regulator [Hylemonella gracilis]|nr:LysR family transcriptional regulator [Hylemonella gracilis]
MNSIGFPRRPNFEFRHLRVFAEVVRHGGFTRAAEVIHATQSTVSKAISQLENEVGKPLLRRHRRGIELTRVGEIVYRRAQVMLAQRELLADELHALAGNPHVTLKLGFSRMETSTFFGRALAEFRRRHPDVEISITVEAESQIVRRLLKGDLDLAGLVSPRDPGLEVLELQREPVFVLLSRENPLALRARLGLGLGLGIGDLRDQQLVLFEEKCQLNEMVVGALAQAGILAPVAIKTSQVGLIHELVAENIGIGFLPRALALNRLHPMVVALPLEGFEPQWTYTVAWARAARLSPTARAWVAVARAVHVFPELVGDLK